MMRIWFFSLICIAALEASPISSPLLDLQGERGTIDAPQVKEGMSGFVVRHFDATHSSIIANARVEEVNPSTHRATLSFSQYDGVKQNTLPSGKWTPKISDEVVIAYDYTRGLLIAPNDDTYTKIAKSLPSIEWIHPDLYATYLSYEGHPTPLVKDFHNFCTSNSIGILTIQSSDTLFTLDCKNFALLEIAPSVPENNVTITPFFTRVATIRGAWWGEGSSKLKSYEPYYLEQIALNNPKNKELYELFKAKFGEKSALLRHFEVKEH